MDSYNRMFDVFIAIAGVYMLYWGFSGKGSLFKIENIKAGYEEKHRKFMRTFCFAGGLLAIAMGVLDYVNVQPYATILFYVLCAVTLIALTASVFFVDRKKAKKCR